MNKYNFVLMVNCFTIVLIHLPCLCFYMDDVPFIYQALYLFKEGAGCVCGVSDNQSFMCRIVVTGGSWLCG